MVVVGNGVGAWISLLIASSSKEVGLIDGIVALGADPDFTDDLLWDNLPVSEKEAIMRDGVADIKWGNQVYPISKSLIEDGRKNFIMRGGRASLDIGGVPVHLIHGLNDEEVPYSTSLRIAEIVKSDNVVVSVVKGAKHNLDREEDYSRMRAAVDGCFEDIVDYDLTSPGSG